MTDQEAFEAFYSPFSEGGAWNRRDPWGKEYDDWGVQMAWRGLASIPPAGAGGSG